MARPPPTVGTVCAAFPWPAVAEARRHVQQWLDQVAPHRPLGRFAVLNTLQGVLSREPGRRPRPPGRARRRVGVSAGRDVLGPPLCPGYNSTERPALAGGRRRAPGTGEMGRAEGCCCGDSGGLRGSGGTT